MTRFFATLALLALVSFGLWPYYTMFRLDQALARPQAQAIAPYVDLPALQARHKARLSRAVGQLLPDDPNNRMMGALTEGLRAFGGAALEQNLTLERVRDLLREVCARAYGHPEAGLIAATDFAFFEAADRFVIRLGKLDENPTHLILALADWQWRVVDIVR